MTIELLYTSAAQGLKQGSRGFCTVVCTAGLPINLAQRLEALSGYRHLYQPGDQRADDNPVCHSHIRLAVGGKTLSILSRVGAYGVDYSQRTNKIAHHVVFDGAVPACGPAAVLSQSGIMRTNWDGECKTLQSGPQVPSIALQPAPCQEWKRMTGDAGWASVVANAWLQSTGKPVWIIFSESQSASLLDLMQEATAILPESRRWQATFSTYCTNLPPDVECRVRCVIAGSDEARMSIARGTVLDLTKPMGVAPDSDATAAARNGYTVGTTSNLVQSIEELNNVSDQTSEESESALSTHGSDEGEYRLKRQLPGRIPIPLAMPSRRRGNEVKRRGSKSPSRQSKIWKVLAVAAGVLIFVSLVGSGVFYFATTKNPIAGIVKDPPREKQEPVSEKTKDNTERNAVPAGDPSADAGAEKKSGTQAPDSPPKIQLSLDQTIREINENDRIEKELLIAKVIPSIANLAYVTLSTGHDYFDYRDGNIYLKAKKDSYNYESTPKLNGEIKIGDKSLPFSVSVNNVKEPDLNVVLHDDSEKPPKGYAFAGSKLSAKAEGKDDDAMDETRTYSWQGDQGDYKWVDFSKNQDVQLDSKFARVRCIMRYATSDPIGGTEVISETIAVHPLGVATLDFSKLFFETSENPQNLQIEVSFLSLPKADRSRYRFNFEGDESYFQEGNLLKTAIPLDIVMENGGPKYFKLPTSKHSKYFEDAKESNLGANNWLQNACDNAKKVRERVAFLKSSMKFFKSSSKVATAFKQFVHDLVEAPNDDFFESVDLVDKWVKEIQRLAPLEKELIPNAVKNTDNENDKKKLETLEKELDALKKELEALKKKYRMGINAFPKLPISQRATVVDDLVALKEINTFANEWYQSGDCPPWSQLVKAVHDLRHTMETSRSFETELTSHEIKIWSVNNSSNSTNELAKSIKRIEPDHKVRFRVTTKVLFTDFKTGTQ